MNVAAETGPSKFDWWKDWRGETVAIVACGPSARNADVEALKGRVKVIAIKEAFNRLAPFADVVYGCEASWWRYAEGLPDFKGLKLAWDGAVVPFHLHRFKLRDRQLDQILVAEPGVIGAGGHSGFQALNIAVQFGAKRVLLVGYDMHAGGGVHFYGRNFWTKANNPDESCFPRWVRGMDNAAKTLTALGVEVVNASPVSRITAFRKASIADTLTEWNV